MTVRDGGDPFADDDIEPSARPPFTAAEPSDLPMMAETTRDPYVEAGWPDTATKDPYVEAGWSLSDRDREMAGIERRSDNRALLGSCAIFVLVVMVGIGGMIAAGIGLANNVDELLGDAVPEPANCQRVWMAGNATPEQDEAVGRLLSQWLAPGQISYVDKDATFAEFASYYADQPDVIELVDPNELPTSFITFLPLGEVQQQELEALPGVQSVDEERFLPGCT